MTPDQLIAMGLIFLICAISPAGRRKGLVPWTPTT
jgi:hypothetical protein